MEFNKEIMEESPLPLSGPTWDSLISTIFRLITCVDSCLDRTGRRALPKAPDSACGDAENMDSYPPTAQARKRMRLQGVASSPALTLWRDTHAWCTHCRMVWMVLEEKKLPYAVETVNLHSYGRKRPDFLVPHLSPNGTVPVLQVGEEVLLGSADVTVDEMLMGLEEPKEREQWALESDMRLLPSGCLSFPCRQEMRRRAWSLLGLRRELWARDQDWLREDMGKGKGKEAGKGRGKEKVAKLEEDKESITRSRFFQGLDWVEKELAAGTEQWGEGPWFFGNQFSLVDIAFSSVIERAFATAFYYKGLTLWELKVDPEEGERGKWFRWPRIKSWLLALGQRPSYRAVASDLHTHAHIHSGRLGKWGHCVKEQGDRFPDAEAAREEVDSLLLFSAGQGGLLDPPELRVMPFLSWNQSQKDIHHDVLEAAFALSKHHVGVQRSACRKAWVLPEDAEMAYLAVVRGMVDFAQLCVDQQGQILEGQVLKACLDEALSTTLQWNQRFTPEQGHPVAALYSGNNQWYRARIVKVEGSPETGSPVFQISWASSDDSQDSLSNIDAYYGDTWNKPLSHLKPHFILTARALHFTADRVCVPRDMGPGAARVLRGCLKYCANVLDPGGATAGSIEIPITDRYDQDPDGFYQVT